MNAKRIISSVVLVIACVATPSFGQLLVEPFAYADGPLVGNGVDISHIWFTHSGTANQMQVVSQAARVVQSTQSEDVSVPMGIVLGAGQKIYAAFDVVIGSNGALAGTSPAYFAHFRDSGTFNFSGRVYATPSGVGGDYTYGLRSGSGTGAAVSWASGFTLGSTQRVVVSYAFDTGTSMLWVNPANEASTSISDTVATSVGWAMENFSLREAAYSTATGVTETVDNLCIDTTFDGANLCVPEPGTAALFGIGLLTLLRRRR